jgi:hypothetical protein
MNNKTFFFSNSGKQNVKWLITLLVFMVVSSYSYAQENISWLRQGLVKIISIDGKKVNMKYPMAVTPGTHSIIVKGLPKNPLILNFEPAKYYRLGDFDKNSIDSLVLNDETDLVLSGFGGVYDEFYAAEKKASITRLSNGIGKIRAPTGKSYFNFGVHNYKAGSSKYSTIRIYSDDGILYVKKFNEEDVKWKDGGKKGNVIVIPSGKHTLILDYLAARPEFKAAGGIIGIISMVDGMVKRGNADKRDTFNIILNYEFFPGAEYEITFKKSKSKGAPYAEVDVIPKKGAPKGQPRGHGTVPSYEDITAANSAAETKKMQMRYSVAINGKQTGPYSYDELRQLVIKGELTKDSLVWKEGMPQWAAAGTVNELADIWTSVPPPLPPSLP